MHARMDLACCLGSSQAQHDLQKSPHPVVSVPPCLDEEQMAQENNPAFIHQAECFVCANVVPIYLIPFIQNRASTEESAVESFSTSSEGMALSIFACESGTG